MTPLSVIFSYPQHSFARITATVLMVSVAALFLWSFPQRVFAADTVIFLTSTGAGTWNVPSDWSGINSIEVIGGGGGGSNGTAGSGGGGGGGYSIASNVTLTPGGTVGYSVGTGGTPGSNGGNTWLCNSTSNCASIGGSAVIVGANGGAFAPATGLTGGAGGSTTGAVGDTTYAGGAGGDANTTTGSGGGGGGAAGPLGAGGAGGDSVGGLDGAGGGGGANNGNVGSNSSGTAGGAGGDSGTAGAGGSGGGTNGAAGTDGGGGEGADRDTQGGNGGAGGNGTSVWTQTSDSATAGPGGGGGGGGNSSTGGNPGGNGGNGGTYGGGAGGFGDDTDGNGTSGTGGQGIIVITYTSTDGALTLSGNVRFNQSLNIVGALSKGSGTFVIDHPLKPRTHLLYHSFVESPDVKNVYDGIASLDALGEATIQLPDYFEALNTDFRYQYTPLEEAMPNLYIKREVQNNQFVIAGGVPNGEVSWHVTGIRHDPYIEANPIEVEVRKTRTSDIPLGECVFGPLCND